MNKIILTPKEAPMTVVAAMFLDNQILMAADSQQTHAVLDGPIYKESIAKLLAHKQFPVVCSFSGGGDVGQEFCRWFCNANFTESTDWQSFREVACHELNRLNGDKRRAMELAGVKPTDNDTAHALVTGYLQEVPNILEMGNDGTYAWHMNTPTPTNFTAIGSGKYHVLMAKRTLEHWFSATNQNVPFDARLLRFVVEVGTSMAPDCSFPVEMVRITATGVTREA